jgi:hypothetical protein
LVTFPPTEKLVGQQELTKKSPRSGLLIWAFFC